MHKFFQLPCPRIDQPHSPFRSSATRFISLFTWEGHWRTQALKGWVVSSPSFWAQDRHIIGRVLCLLGILVFSRRTLLKRRCYFLLRRSCRMLSVCDAPKPSLLPRTAMENPVGKCCVISVWNSSLLLLNDHFVFECAGLHLHSEGSGLASASQTDDSKNLRSRLLFFAPLRAGLWMCGLFRMLTWWFLADIFCRISSYVCLAPSFWRTLRSQSFSLFVFWAS